MSLFGQGAVNIAGHKISYGLLAAVGGIGGAILLVIQMRNSGGGISAGQGTYTDAAGNVYDANGNLISAAPSSATGGDWQSAFAALSDQIASLSQGTNMPSSSGPSAPGSAAAAAGYAGYTAQLGNTGIRTGGGMPASSAAAAPIVNVQPSAAVGARAPIYPSGPGIDATTFPGTVAVTVAQTPVQAGRIVARPVKKYTVDLNTPAPIAFNPIKARSSGTQAVA